jgi:hypothetical protein
MGSVARSSSSTTAQPSPVSGYVPLLPRTARTGRLTQDHGWPDPAHQEPTWTKTSGEREAERLQHGKMSQETTTPPCDGAVPWLSRSTGDIAVALQRRYRLDNTTPVPSQTRCRACDQVFLWSSLHCIQQHRPHSPNPTPPHCQTAIPTQQGMGGNRGPAWAATRGLSRRHGPHPTRHRVRWQATAGAGHPARRHLDRGREPKAQAAGHYKGGFGFHPLTSWCTNIGDALAVMQRPGNAGSFTAADHLAVLQAALAQIPAPWRTDVLVSIDGAGASHDVIDYLTSLNTGPEHGKRGRIPDRLPTHRMDGSAGPVTLGQGGRNPRASSSTRDAAPPSRPTSDVLGGSGTDRGLDPQTAQHAPDRPARHARNNPALAPATRYPPLDHQPVPARSTTCPGRTTDTRDTSGQRESHLGLPASARRTRRPRLPDRRLHHLEDPQGRRNRPLTTAIRPRPGHSSSEPKPTPSWPATCSTSTPSP